MISGKRSKKTKDILEQMKAEGAADFDSAPKSGGKKLEKADPPVPVTGTSETKKKQLKEMSYDAENDGDREEDREIDLEIAEPAFMAKLTKKRKR